MKTTTRFNVQEIKKRKEKNESSKACADRYKITYSNK